MLRIHTILLGYSAVGALICSFKYGSFIDWPMDFQFPSFALYHHLLSYLARSLLSDLLSSNVALLYAP